MEVIRRWVVTGEAFAMAPKKRVQGATLGYTGA